MQKTKHPSRRASGPVPPQHGAPAGNVLRVSAEGAFDLRPGGGGGESADAGRSPVIRGAGLLGSIGEDFQGFTADALQGYRRGLREAQLDPREIPVRMAHFTRAFYIGGTEAQLTALLAGLPQDEFSLSVGVLNRAGPLLPKVEALGLSPSEFPLGSKFARPQTVASVARLAGWLRERRIELLHVHDFAATLVAVPAAKLAGCKVVVSRLDLAHYHSRGQRAVLAGLTRAADHVVVNAEAIRTMLIEEEGIPHQRISLIRNGLDLPAFDRAARAGLTAPVPDTGGDPVLLHVANMNHPVKRQEDLIQAMALLQDLRIPVQAFLVGDGPRRQELEALCGKLRVQQRVHFLGYRTDVPALYGKAAVSVLCSSAEGLSNAIIESMAASVPVVATNVGGSPELVRDGERGLIVPPFTPASLALAIERLLGDRERARAMGAAARTWVERNLTLETMVTAHADLYRRLTGG